MILQYLILITFKFMILFNISEKIDTIRLFRIFRKVILIYLK